MANVKSKDTRPEMIVRRLTHGMGFRYRLHVKALPGKPDLVFPRRKKVIFVHGCFWHGHDCKAGRNRPASNKSYWNVKLERNISRDKENLNTLEKMGWNVLIVWECQTKDIGQLAEIISNFLGRV